MLLGKKHFFVGLLLVGGALAVLGELSSRKGTLDIPVPVLQENGVIVAAWPKTRPSLRAQVIRKVRKDPDVFLKDFRGTTVEKYLDAEQPGDSAVFECPSGTNIRVDRMTRRPFRYTPAGGTPLRAWAYTYADPPGDGTREAELVRQGNPHPFAEGRFIGDAGPSFPSLDPNGTVKDGLTFLSAHVNPGTARLDFFCTYTPMCGDTLLNTDTVPPEQCDDGCLPGTTDHPPSCDALPLEGGDGCSPACQTTTQCEDGVSNGDPEDTLVDAADAGCHTDGNALNPASYNSTDDNETNAASCGNGATEPDAIPPEECDDGNTSEIDACLNNCRNNACGDGHMLVNGPTPEDCDDGRTKQTEQGFVWCNDSNDPLCLVQGNDGCNTQCNVEPGSTCTRQADPTGNPDNPTELKRSDCLLTVPSGPS